MRSPYDSLALILQIELDRLATAAEEKELNLTNTKKLKELAGLVKDFAKTNDDVDLSRLDPDFLERIIGTESVSEPS